MQTTIRRRRARTRDCCRECLIPQDPRLVESTRGTLLRSVGLGSGLGLAELGLADLGLTDLGLTDLGQWALAAIDLGLV